MRLSSLVLLFLLSLSAQQQYPDASRLFDASGEAVKRYRTYQYTMDMTIEMTIEGNPMKIATTMVGQFANPGKFHLESTAAGAPAATVISDGEYVWTYMPFTKQYSKQAAGAMPSLDELGLGGIPNDSQLTSAAKVVRSEVLDVDGNPHDCWVIESRIASLEMGSVAMQDVINNWWIDKQLGLMLQTETSAKVLGGMLQKTKMVTHSLKFDEDLPDSLFKFTVPEGASEVADLIPRFVAAPGIGAAPAQARPRPDPQPGEPQAFVPNLTPIQRTPPEYPAAARDQGIQGMVDLLLTIDAAGYVLSVETLSGPVSLRQAAIDSVRQWMFRPVIRNGTPVPAYTETSVGFFDPANPIGARAAINGDLADQMAASRRTAELERKFPRSAAQVFADLEQDRSGVTGIERDFALPDLAKKAVAAGALDRAMVYADELLKVGPQSGNYGQAVHDGNMVRGLVALRQGNIPIAAHDLIEAGKTSGSAVLNSFGPNMTLAKELLEKGERDAVLEYLGLCRKFWKLGAERLDAWTATIRSGGVPDFNANLLY